MNGSGSTGRDVFWWIALFQTPERSARPSGVRGTGVPFGFGISVSTGDAGGWALDRHHYGKRQGHRDDARDTGK